MTGNEYQKFAARTINHNLSKRDQINHALFGMCGEVGELHSLYQKRFQGHTFEENDYKKELGDLLWFIAEYCTANGWLLEDIMKMNVTKLYKRYPEGFVEECSIFRDESNE